MSLRIYLTGRVALEATGELVVQEREFRGRQGRLAFAYLVLERTRPVPREELAEVIWPDAMPPAWDNALNALISRIRTMLARPALASRGARLSQEFGQYQLYLPTDTWVDIETAVTALHDAEAALRAGDARKAFGPATVAATISKRPFLAGNDCEWTAAQRRKQERLFLRGLGCLAQVGLETGEPLMTIECASEAIAVDPFQEQSYRLLMRAYKATGNRPRAVQTYRQLESFLRAELGTQPTAETAAEYQALLA